MDDIGQKPQFLRARKDDFFKELAKEVHETVLKNKRLQHKNIAKALGLLILFFISYSCILAFGNNTVLLFTIYIIMGFTMILIFVNSFHDASHGALFPTKKQNRTFCYVIDFFGTNSEIWIQRHLLLHHPYPNIQNWDCDIKQSDVIHIFPNSPLYKFHKYQHIYIWFLYPFYTLIWLYIRDFKDFFGTKDNYLKRVYTIPSIEYVNLFVAKIFNLFHMLLIPYWVLEQSFGTIFLAWIVMHLASSLFGVVALVSTHADESANFPLPPLDGKMKVTWVEHQLMVTKDFNAGDPIFDFLYGGFTHHVAHHLFPTIGHTYYPKITPIIRKYANEKQLPYTCRPVLKAIKSHYLLLKNSSQPDSIFNSSEL
jgi:linoleoyl-CoA desaturase